MIDALSRRKLFGIAISSLALASALISFGAANGHALADQSVDSAGDIRISGVKPGRAPLVFACCELPTSDLDSVFSNPAVISDLKDLHASLALPVMDLSPGRARIVRQLNDAGIPVIAWIVLSKEHGYYLNADNAPDAVARFAEFEKWTAEYSLRWAAVGLDIEPNFAEFQAMKGHKWRLASMLLRRYFDSERVRRARESYTELIQRIQSRGYPVQTYQLAIIVGERKMHTTLAERLLGIVDVRGNLEVLMLYTSFSPALDSALIWKFGPDAQGIAVGSTAADPKSAPLTWDEFSRDLIVATHFAPVVGVYSLEGCIQQGFLPRLKTMNWEQSVTIPAEAIKNVNRLGAIIETALWIGSHLLYLAAATFLVVGLLIWRRHRRKSAGLI
jgi:hypothetical protein